MKLKGGLSFSLQILKNNSPLLVPILLGWERQLTKHKNQGRRSASDVVCLIFFGGSTTTSCFRIQVSVLPDPLRPAPQKPGRGPQVPASNRIHPRNRLFQLRVVSGGGFSMTEILLGVELILALFPRRYIHILNEFKPARVHSDIQVVLG